MIPGGDLKLPAGFRAYLFMVKKEDNPLPEKIEDFHCIRSEGLFLSKKMALDSARGRHIVEDAPESRFHIAANFERKDTALTAPGLIKLLRENSYPAALPKVDSHFLFQKKKKQL